jgi:hypothetical protein
VFDFLSALEVIGISTECSLIIEEFLRRTFIMPCALPPVFSLRFIEIIQRLVLFRCNRRCSTSCAQISKSSEGLLVDKLLCCRIATLTMELIRSTVLCLCDRIEEGLRLSTHCLISTENISTDWLILFKESLSGGCPANLAIVFLIKSRLFIKVILRLLDNLPLRVILIMES